MAMLAVSHMRMRSTRCSDALKFIIPFVVKYAVHSERAKLVCTIRDGRARALVQIRSGGI